MHELDHYIYPHRVLHWLVAGAALLSLASGLTLGFLGFERTVSLIGTGLTNVLYTSHKTLGVTILLLMTLRIITRIAFVVPDHDPPLNGFERIVSTSVHHLLYAALVVMPLLGWAATASGGFPWSSSSGICLASLANIRRCRSNSSSGMAGLAGRLSY